MMNISILLGNVNKSDARINSRTLLPIILIILIRKMIYVTSDLFFAYTLTFIETNKAPEIECTTSAVIPTSF